MPVVSQMSHTGRLGCRVCETVGVHPDNSSAGMYFPNNQAPIRHKIDFLKGHEAGQ